MADNLTLVGSAIYSRIGGTATYTYVTSGTALTTGTVGVWDTRAPQDRPTAPPYIIYQMMVANDDYAFRDDWHSLSMDIAVRVVSDRQYPIQARQIYETAHGRLQDAALTVTGFATMRCRRMSPIEYLDTKNYWNSGGIFRIDIVRVSP